MQKIYNILTIFIIILTIFSFINKVQATDIWDVGKDWIDTGTEQKNDTTFKTLESDSKTKFQALIDLLWGLGLLVAAVTTVILGVKLMTVPPGEKSRAKQSISAYLTGIIIIFGALTIWKVLVQILDGSL